MQKQMFWTSVSAIVGSRGCGDVDVTSVLHYVGYRCRWQGIACKPEYISSVLTEMGRCYTFNGNPKTPLYMDKTGNLVNIDMVLTSYQHFFNFIL